MEEEWLDVVDDDDRVIGRELKKHKAAKGFLSRNVVVHLQTSDGRFVMVQRAAHKKIDPLKLDLAACGNVMAGESYEEAAIRELSEEVGIETSLKLLAKRKTTIPVAGSAPLEFLTSIFYGIHDGPYTFNDESAGVRMMTLDEIERTVHQSPELICKPFIEDFELTKEQLRQFQHNLRRQ